MKYIKTFEKKISLKEYVVINHEYTYLVLRINKIKPSGQIYYTSLYNFNKKVNKGSFINGDIGSDSGYYSGEKFKDIIVFQSDNFDKCIEMLPALNKMNKYNL